ncbi:MAG TPA: tetratricopeptide repeat protein [Lacunisphaera sp.]|nr:tetratricopeptide repeat protein [Lacunisphaera sp.]
MPRPNPHPASAPPTRPAAGDRSSASGWLILFLLASLVVYWPALRGDFLWDDLGHVTSPALQSLSGLGRIWSEPGTTQQYYPMLHSAFWLEHVLWGDATAGYHLVNVLQHALAAFLFGLLLRRLALPGAWTAALLFLLHPVCVESVAWISEQKNTLSLVLYLGAALAWLRFDTARGKGAYALATGLFVAALLTKTVTATLPAALLVLIWFRRGTLRWREDVVPLLPWFALGVGGGLFTAHFERVGIGAEGADFGLGALDRLVLAGRVFWFYLAKLAWPADLVFVYPRWNVDAGVWWQWLFPAAGLGLLAGFAWWSRRSRAPLAAALLFGGSLFPALGFVNVYPFVFSFVADHFQYLASLAVFALAGAGLALLPRPAGIAAAIFLAALLGILAWQQAAVYRDNVTLYGHTLRSNPDAWLAHHNLGTILSDQGRPAEALPHVERTLALRPDYPEALNNLGNCLTALGKASEALAPLERAIQLQPKYAAAYNNLGIALMGLGRAEEGRARFETAVTLDPQYVAARRNLGLALARAGRVSEALPQFEAAVKLSPDDVDARLQLGTALFTLSRPDEAVPQYEAALALQPDSAAAHYNLGLALHKLGRITEAKAHLDEAAALDPRFAR